MATKKHLAKTDENLEESGVEILDSAPVVQVDDSLAVSKDLQQLFFEKRKLALNNDVEIVTGNDLDILNTNYFKKTVANYNITLNVLNIENGKKFNLFVENNFFGFGGQVAGMTTDIVIEKTSGSCGRGILPADGIKNINTLISEWNTFNPLCQISLVSGDGSQVPTENIILDSSINLNMPDVNGIANLDSSIGSFLIEFTAVDGEIYGVQKKKLDRGVLEIAAGNNHSLALKSNGEVWAWGRNGDGELGNNSTANSSVPVQVVNQSDFVAIAGGGSHSLALKSNGEVWAWGSNSNGQLGDGTSGTDRLVPVKVADGDGVNSDFVAISGNNLHSLALKSNGEVWAWGRNSFGRLGDNSTTNRSAPVKVADGDGVNSDFVAIAAGGTHSLALKSNGEVWAWGYNLYGRLGDNSTTDRLVPVRVVNQSDFVAIASGGSHSLALKSNGEAWAWGYNGNGELGDGTVGTINNKSAPVKVVNQSDFVAIASGLALKSNGEVWSWGFNGSGQLGNNSTTNSPVPVKVVRS
jgi:hypothetical protein